MEAGWHRGGRLKCCSSCLIFLVGTAFVTVLTTPKSHPFLPESVFNMVTGGILFKLKSDYVTALIRVGQWLPACLRIKLKFVCRFTASYKIWPFANSLASTPTILSFYFILLTMTSCFRNMPRIFLPQGLCTYYALCPGGSSTSYPHCAPDTQIVHSLASLGALLKCHLIRKSSYHPHHSLPP